MSLHHRRSTAQPEFDLTVLLTFRPYSDPLLQATTFLRVWPKPNHRPDMFLHLLAFLLATVACGTVLCAPTSQTSATPRPLVVWHGLGDSYASPGMLEFMQLIREMHPGIFVHSVHIKDNIEEDQKAGWVRYTHLSGT